MDLRWRELTNDERQTEYSPSSMVNGDIQPFLDAYVARSEAARKSCIASGRELLEVSYGALSSQTIDLVVPAGTSDAPCPLVVYIHGGYWQLLSKRESFFGAPECLNAGVAFAAVDYTLAPEASLDEIVAECRAALAALVDSAATYGYDPAQIFVAGSSAGAHLSAMVALDSQASVQLAGVILVSGVFELEPLIGTSINDAVGMDHAEARRNSPMQLDLASFPETVIAVGEIETDEFKRQSAVFGERLAAAGIASELIEIPDRNHFDVVLEVAKPGTLLGDAVFRLIRQTAQRR